MRKKVICYDDYYPASVYDREHQELETVAIFDELCKALGINSKNNPNLFYDENIEIIGKSFYTDALKSHKENQKAIFNDYTIDRLKYIISLALDIDTDKRKGQVDVLYKIRETKNTKEGLKISSAERCSRIKRYEITRQFLYDIIMTISDTTDNVGGIKLLAILLEDIENFERSQDINMYFLPGLSHECIDAFKYFTYHFICRMFEKCKGKETVSRCKIRNSYLSILTRNYYYDIYTVLQDYMACNIDNLDFYDLLPTNLEKAKTTRDYYHPEDDIRTKKTVFLYDINPTKYNNISEQFSKERQQEYLDDDDDDDESHDDDKRKYFLFTPESSVNKTK